MLRKRAFCNSTESLIIISQAYKNSIFCLFLNSFPSNLRQKEKKYRKNLVGCEKSSTFALAFEKYFSTRQHGARSSVG